MLPSLEEVGNNWHVFIITVFSHPYEKRKRTDMYLLLLSAQKFRAHEKFIAIWQKGFFSEVSLFIQKT
jgi:hypothetical protein